MTSDTPDLDANNHMNTDKPSGKAEAILAGATREFLEHGYAATSMDRVAAAAGVSKATVYSHFHDKANLFSHLFEHAACEKLLAVFSLPGNTTDGIIAADPGATLRGVASRMLDAPRHDPQFLGFIRLLYGESGRFPELASMYIHNLLKPTVEQLTRYLVAHPQLHLDDPKATAHVFINSLIHFIISQQMMGGESIMPLAPGRFTDNLVRMIVPQTSIEAGTARGSKKGTQKRTTAKSLTALDKTKRTAVGRKLPKRK